jgi:hypothetical protein
VHSLGRIRCNVLEDLSTSPWKNKEYSSRRIRYILVKEGALFEKNKAHSASRMRCTLLEE